MFSKSGRLKETFKQKITRVMYSTKHRRSFMPSYEKKMGMTMTGLPESNAGITREISKIKSLSKVLSSEIGNS